ncbi:MAG: LptF/LptG family permease [Planctomycetota bacterium]|jgi:lipopolysaccharide export LptBFGC system permease protein LptF
MTFTLHRYIFRELIKVFVLAAVALTVILSLGSVLRPVYEYGVGPGQVIYLMGYSLPIILTFVLPIAALFSSALIYGRFACFNELDACKASGISLLTTIYPGVVLAIMVAIANLVLSFHVMPLFIERSKAALEADVQKIIFRNIQRNGYYEINKKNESYLIYADQSDPRTGILSGVVITELEGVDVKSLVTAESAKLKFSLHGKFNEVRVTAYNTYEMGINDEVGISLEVLSLVHEFDSLMGDNIKFKKIKQMKEIQANPMTFYPIEKIAINAYVQLIKELLIQDISSTGNSDFYRLRCGERYVDFSADKCSLNRDEQIELSGGVIVRDATKKPLKTFNCEKAILHIEGDERAPTLAMELYNAVDNAGSIVRRPVIYGLLVPQAIVSRLAVNSGTEGEESGDILSVVNPQFVSEILKGGGSGILKGYQGNLQKTITKTLLAINAELHSRLVFGIGCVPMILIGIGLGIIKKDGHLLSAFGASVVPALLLIVCIMMGKNVAKNVGSQAGSGVLMMWIGLFVLCMLAGWIYRKLLKN